MKGKMSWFSGFDVSSKPETSLGGGSPRRAVLVGAPLLALLLTLSAPVAAQPEYFTYAGVAAGFIPSDPVKCPIFSDHLEDGGDGVPSTEVFLDHVNPCGGGVGAEARSDLFRNDVHVGIDSYGPMLLAVADAAAFQEQLIYFMNVTEPFTLYLVADYRAQKTNAIGELQISDAVVIPLTETFGEWVPRVFEVVVFPQAPVVPLNINASVGIENPQIPSSGGWDVRMSQMIVPPGITCRGSFPSGWVQEKCDAIGRVH